MHETTALGAAMAAGNAVGLWDLQASDAASVTTDSFAPSIGEEGHYFVTNQTNLTM